MDRLRLEIPLPQHPKPLSFLQSKVLRWVNDGCPGGIFEGYSHRISARALADDRYITITGKGPTWTAKITQLGVELLKSIEDSDSNNHTHESEADKFIQKLTAADGLFEVEGGYSHRAANDALIRDVMKSALRPKGYKPEITSVGSWQSPKYEARWARHFPDDVDERPVPIPDSVGKYHPVAKAFRDGTKGVSKEHVSRAAKLLHALATESTARGYDVTLPSSHKRTDTRRTTTLDGDIAITIGTTTVPLEMRELPPNDGAVRPYIPRYNPRDRDPKFLASGGQGLPSGRNALRQIRSFSPGPTRQRNFRFPHTPGLPYRRPAADAGLGPCLTTKTSSCSEKNGSSSSRNTRTAAAGVERSGVEKIPSWIPCSTENLPSQNDLADTYKR